ncbi:MAG TPA: peptidoglycan recognition family protein [Roseiflexaceae bacterium]|nr:peptidoglycan recognition family protein [Roseiflexaceae bacterium]
MAFDLSTYRKDTRWAVGHGYGPVFDGGPSRRTTAQITSILVHTTNSPVGNTAYAIEAAFLRDSPDVSIHYVVSSHDDTIVQVLPEPWIAWHAGACADKDYENPSSIGIEIAWCPQAGALPQIAINNLTRLVRDIRQRYPWIAKIDMHRAQAVPKGRKIDPSGWSDAAFYAWRDSLLQGSSLPPASSLPTPLPYVGAPQSISAATFTAVLVDHQSPLAPWAETLYRWCNDVDIDACVALAHCHAESDFGKDEPARSLANPFNLKENFGFAANADGFSDFSGGPNGGGGPWLGWRWGIDWLKRYGALELQTLEQIAPLFVTGNANANVDGYIAKIRATVAEIRKREHT